jgi:hypothetical protein
VPNNIVFIACIILSIVWSSIAADDLVVITNLRNSEPLPDYHAQVRRILNSDNPFLESLSVEAVEGIWNEDGWLFPKCNEGLYLFEIYRTRGGGFSLADESLLRTQLTSKDGSTNVFNFARCRILIKDPSKEELLFEGKKIVGGVLKRIGPSGKYDSQMTMVLLPDGTNFAAKAYLPEGTFVFEQIAHRQVGKRLVKYAIKSYWFDYNGAGEVVLGTARVK